MTHERFADPNDLLKTLPPTTYAFLDVLIAQLESEAAEPELADEERERLNDYAARLRGVRHALRERDVVVSAIISAELDGQHAEVAHRAREGLMQLQALDL